MSRSQVRRVSYELVVAAALGVSPLPSYALADNIISQVVGGLLFIVACVVAAIAALSALLALVTGHKAASRKSALVALLVLAIGWLLKPAPSYTFQYSDAIVANVPYPFGLVIQPDTTDTPTTIPLLRGYDLAADSAHFDKIGIYVGYTPQLAGGNTEAIRFVQKYLRYPAPARQHHTTGLVAISFVVDEAGEVHNTKVIRSLGDGCEEEALRVVRGLPTFQNNAGEPVQLTWLFSFRPPEIAVPTQ